MSRTTRNKPYKKLTKKEEKYVERGKYHHPVETKENIYEASFGSSANQEAKKRKNRKQRNSNKKEIEDQVKDVE